MSTFLIFNLKVAVLIAVFYMFYRLLLSKETLHRLNRIVLLSTAAVSLILPLCIITTYRTEIISSARPSVDVLIGDITQSEAVSPWWMDAIAIAYILGVVFVVCKVLVSFISILHFIHNARDIRKYNNHHLIITDNKYSPFSWMNYIVINRNDYEQGINEILDHEEAHIRLHHSWDVLFMDLVSAIQWFNPAIWMLRSDLLSVHEYEADEAVLCKGVNLKHYQYLLVSKAIANSGFTITNRFNHNKLKLRIKMMTSKKSNKYSALKVLYVLPIVGISLAMSAKTVVNYQYEEQEELAAPVKQAVAQVTQQPEQTIVEAEPQSSVTETEQISETPQELAPAAENAEDKNEPFNVVDKMPEFQGGMRALMDYLSSNLKYPELAHEIGLQGRVIVSFVVGKNGEVYDLKIEKSAGPDNPDKYKWGENDKAPQGEALEKFKNNYAEANKLINAEAIRCVESTSGLWTAGSQNGKAVNVKYTLPLSFRLK